MDISIDASIKGTIAEKVDVLWKLRSSFLKEPVKLRFRLAVLNFPIILRLNCSESAFGLFRCRQFRH